MNIVIIGCGRMGSGLADALSRSQHDVTVVDTNQDVLHRMDPGSGVQVIIGDALEKESLIKAGIKRADGLAAVTGSDAINVVVARVARQIFHVPNVVARTHDPQNAEIYRRLGIQTVTNVTLGISRLLELLTFSHLDVIHTLGNGEVGIVKIEVPSLLIGHSILHVTIPGEIQVIAITRDGKTSLPSTGTIFQKKDVVHVCVEEHSVERLKRLLGSP